MAAGRSLGNLNLGKTALFVCDIQERFRPAIKYFVEVVEVSKRLVEGAKILNVPIIATEQYPKGLGSTVEELDIQNHATKIVSKTKFSMLIPEVLETLPNLCDGNLKHIILCGIEAHVCIQQTVIDLLERGYDVHVVADATSSRSQMDRIMAFERFRHCGAIVTTSEAVLLQLVGDKDHPNFKAIQGLIKVSAPESGLVSPL